MTSIKPPDGKVPGAGLDSGAPAETEGAERAGQASFRDLVGKASAAGPASGASGSAAADPIAELAQAIRSGAITREQAIDQLVERTVASMSRTLTQAQRDELTAVLRQALESDPALLSLRAALG
jgi:hypothetical protein